LEPVFACDGHQWKVALEAKVGEGIHLPIIAQVDQAIGALLNCVVDVAHPFILAVVELWDISFLPSWLLGVCDEGAGDPEAHCRLFCGGVGLFAFAASALVWKRVKVSPAKDAFFGAFAF
jgi:hypothetical protein